MSRDDRASLRKKFEELEEEVRKLKEPLESTLMDVRELVANLENPFNYASSILGNLEKENNGEKSLKREEEKKLEKAESLGERFTHRSDRVEPAEEESLESFPRVTGSIGRRLASQPNSLAVIGCAYMLVRLLGLNTAVKFLNSRAARKFASPELLDLLLDAVEFIVGLSMFGEKHGGRGRKSSEELMLTAAYLLSMLSSGADEKFFTSLILASRILDLNLNDD